MRKVPWIAYLWPGLPNVWYSGSGSGLLKALAAAAALNFTLLAWFGWSELLGVGIRNAIGGVLALLWVISAVVDYAKLRRHSQPRRGPDVFAQATDCYLQGDYFQAEQLLCRSLRSDPHDLDARLLLATVYRRQKRRTDAARQLDEIARCDGAIKWSLEIDRERALLNEVKDADADAEDPLPSIEPRPRLVRAA
jgi:hypothetical protein